MRSSYWFILRRQDLAQGLVIGDEGEGVAEQRLAEVCGRPNHIQALPVEGTVISFHRIAAPKEGEYVVLTGRETWKAEQSWQY